MENEPDCTEELQYEWQDRDVPVYVQGWTL